MRTLVPALALAVALALPAAADHCTSWTTSTTNERTIVFDLGPAAVDFRYVVNDVCQIPPGDPTGWPDPGLYGPYVPLPGWDWDGNGHADGCLFSIWLYYESNGIEGLQRGDEVVDDSCHWSIESDAFVW